MSKKTGGVAVSYVDGFFAKSDEVAAEGAKLQPKEVFRGAHKTAAAIFLLSLAARGLFFVEIHSILPFNVLELDAREYYLIAKDIVGGNFAPTGVFFTSPLYAYFLAAIFRLFDGGIETVRAVQMLAGSLIPVFLFHITRRFFGEAAAIAAGIIAALYGPFIFHDALLLKTSLEIFLVSLGFFLLLAAKDRGSRPLWLFSGIVWGLAAATKENNLLFVPFIFLWLIEPESKNPAGSTRSFPEFTLSEVEGPRMTDAAFFDFKKALLPFAIFIAGFILPIIPFTAHNAIAGKDFVLIGSAGGANFYQGNFRGSDGINKQPGFSRADPGYEERDWKDEAERIAGQPLKPSQVSKFWFREGLKEIAADPFFFLKNTLRKFGLAFNRAEPADDYPPDFYYQFSRLFKFVFLRAWPVLALSLFGSFLYFSRGNRRGAFLLITFILTYLAGLVAFHTNSRYRLPLIFALIPFAAFGLVQGIGILRGDRPKGVRIIIMVFIACALIPAIPLHSFTPADVSDSYNTLGQIELDGRFDEAAAFYREALKIAPANNQARINLIEALLEAKRPGEAYDAAREAVTRFPGIDRYYVLLGIAARAREMPPDEALYMMKMAYEREGISRTGISDDAGAAFRYLVRRGRGDLAGKNYPSAIEAFEEAIQLRPNSATVAFLLAQGYELGGNMAKAGQCYTRALDIEPLFLVARYNLAMNELRTGKNDDALLSLKGIAAALPGYAETEKHIGYILKKR